MQMTPMACTASCNIFRITPPVLKEGKTFSLGQPKDSMLMRIERVVGKGEKGVCFL